MDLPPSIVASVDQGYAAAQQRLNELIGELAHDMADRPTQTDAMPWAASVLFMMSKAEEVGMDVPTPLLEVWQAAIYRLARQKADSAD